MKTAIKKLCEDMIWLRNASYPKIDRDFVEYAVEHSERITESLLIALDALERYEEEDDNLDEHGYAPTFIAREALKKINSPRTPTRAEE